MKRKSSSDNPYSTNSSFLASSANIVISRGNPSSSLMLIGEAPGALEDIEGKPFVGRSGKLLDKLLIEVSIDPNEDIYVANVLKCRPPKNRKPTSKEIEEHMPWLVQQIKLVKPSVIILAGSTATKALLKNKTKISQIRGVWQNWEGISVMPIFHPSYLLRNPSRVEGGLIDLTILDLCQVKERLEEVKLSPNMSFSEKSQE